MGQLDNYDVVHTAYSLKNITSEFSNPEIPIIVTGSVRKSRYLQENEKTMAAKSI